MDEQRKAFEAWLNGGIYRGSQADIAWAAWQAATAAERERCEKLCDFVAELGAKDRMHGAVVVATELAYAIRKGKIPPDG